MDISELRRKAASNSVVAQSILGICYLDGIEVEVNYQKAYRLLSATSDQGAPRATAHLARMYAARLGVSKDLFTAVRLFEKSAEAGEFLAQIELARIYAHGNGVPVDRNAAVRWYSLAVAQANKVGESDALSEAKTYIEGAS